MSRPEASIETEATGCPVCGGNSSARIGSARDFEYATCANDFPYAECSRCGSVYLEERPVPATLATIYPPSYGNYESDRASSLTFRIKSWLDARAVRALWPGNDPPRRILDVGCADGRMLDQCRRIWPDAGSLEGVEISADAARGARAKGYPVTIGTIDTVELPEASYDLVFLQQVIEHVYSPGAVVERLARSLAPGGLVLFETPNRDCLDFRLFRRRYWGGYHAPRHFQIFCERSLALLCTKAGLEHVTTRFTPQPIHWAWSFHHLLADRGAPSWSYGWLHLENPIAMGVFTGFELAAGLLTRRMSNLRIVARRPDQSRHVVGRQTPEA